jgi:hypothetical protein
VKGAILRGMTSETGPRSVRLAVRVSPRAVGRADDSGCPKVAEEGNASRMRHKAYAPAHAREIVACVRQNASFARSFDPRTSILTRFEASSALRGEAADSVSRLGKPTQVGGTSTGAGRTGVARLAACRRFRKEEARHGRTGRRSRPPSLRGSTRVPVWLLVRRVSVADVGRRHLASNKLGTRAPKRAVRVE